LILRKIFKFVFSRCQMTDFTVKMHQIQFFCGYALDLYSKLHVWILNNKALFKTSLKTCVA